VIFALDPGFDHYGVMGKPIAHSQSPFIHARFAEQTGQAIRYQAILVEPGHLAAAVEGFRLAGGLGLNITVPHKQDAWRLADRLKPRAERAQAVNTLWFEAEHTHGDNTDGAGLLRDLSENLNFELAQARVLILGAGGSVRGILPPILESGPACVTIANRTVGRAEELVTHFDESVELEACGYEELAGQQFDLIVNASSASLRGELPPLPRHLLAPGGLAYDLMYAPGDTVFLRWAHEQGADRAIDGLGMLVEQAAEAFALWRGVHPETAVVIQALRAHLRHENSSH
jgi:shikimate dehydrogenase